ncbi:hypothetical protein H4R35_007032, partial [Dimargaris xerosporica]
MGRWLQGLAIGATIGLRLIGAQENLATHSSFLVSFNTIGADAEATDFYYTDFKQRMDEANIPFTLEKSYSRGISAVSVAMDKQY